METVKMNAELLAWLYEMAKLGVEERGQVSQEQDKQATIKQHEETKDDDRNQDD
jgi:hypothetical protein